MKIKYLLPVTLELFDGAAAGGEGAGAPGAEGGTLGETQASSGSTRRGKSGESKSAAEGKRGAPAQAGQGAQADPDRQDASDAGKQRQDTKAQSLEDRRRAFQELVSGEYKDIYTQETQRIIDRRFKETKGLQSQVERSQPVIDLLMERYNIPDGDLDKLADAIRADGPKEEKAAGEAEVSAEQYQKLQALQRENARVMEARRREQQQRNAQRQLSQWSRQAAQAMEAYPRLDLGAEARDPRFLSMLRAGVPVRQAYEVAHMDEIGAARARAAEMRVVAGIRARGQRPQENGVAAQSAFVSKEDVSKLTRQQRADIAQRVAHGERVTF